MNRRSFLAALGLSPVVTATVAALPTEEVAVRGVETKDLTLTIEDGDSIPFAVSQSGEVFVGEAQIKGYSNRAYPMRVVSRADGGIQSQVLVDGDWYTVWDGGFV